MLKTVPKRRVCLFCGSGEGVRPAYVEAAQHFGRTLAERNLGLVYGGASIGLMGAAADAALAAGGEVIGVIPRAMIQHEIAHTGLTQQHIVESMHERKALMTRLSDAFIALPGGHGTLDELFEALTWSQLGMHENTIGALNVQGYWDPLLTMMNHLVGEGFVHPVNRARLIADDELPRLLDALLP